MSEKTFTLDELLGWRLHWIMCEIDEKLEFHSSRRSGDLNWANLAIARKVLSDIMAKVNCVAWEFDVIRGCRDTDKLIRLHERHQDVLDSEKKFLQFLNMSAEMLSIQDRNVALAEFASRNIGPPKVVNYIVTTHCWKGRRVTECETEKEAWDAIGQRVFGGLYDISSPTGMSVSEFIPF